MIVVCLTLLADLPRAGKVSLQALASGVADTAGGHSGLQRIALKMGVCRGPKTEIFVL